MPENRGSRSEGTDRESGREELFKQGETPGTGEYKCVSCNEDWTVTLREETSRLPPCAKCGPGVTAEYERIGGEGGGHGRYESSGRGCRYEGGELRGGSEGGERGGRSEGSGRSGRSEGGERSGRSESSERESRSEREREIEDLNREGLFKQGQTPGPGEYRCVSCDEDWRVNLKEEKSRLPPCGKCCPGVTAEYERIGGESGGRSRSEGSSRGGRYESSERGNRS